MKVTKKVPIYEQDLVIENEEQLVQLFNQLAKEGKAIHIIIGETSEIVFYSLDRVEANGLYDKDRGQFEVFFMKGKETVGMMTIPRGKVYLHGPAQGYIEILEGFDSNTEELIRYFNTYK